MWKEILILHDFYLNRHLKTQSFKKCCVAVQTCNPKNIPVHFSFFVFHLTIALSRQQQIVMIKEQYVHYKWISITRLQQLSKHALTSLLTYPPPTVIFDSVNVY